MWRMITKKTRLEGKGRDGVAATGGDRYQARGIAVTNRKEERKEHQYVIQ